MNNKSFKFFLVFIIVLLIGGVAFLVISLTNTVNKGEIILQDHFNNLSEYIFSMREQTSEMTTDFISNLEVYLSSDPYISAVTIKENGSGIYAWPVTSRNITINSDNDIKLSSNTPFLMIYETARRNSVGNVITVSAALNTILQNEFYRLCTITFIIILSGTVLDLLIIAYIKIFSSKKDGDSAGGEDSDDENEDEDTEAEDSESPEGPHPVDESDPAALNELEKEINDISGNVKDSIPVETIGNQDESFGDVEDNNPAGLFSETTGFGWESYLEPRLDAELERAAANEMDLSLFIIHIASLDRKSVAAKEICTVLSQFFKYSDMLFEYADSSYAGILVNVSIDEAMPISEQLYIEIKKVMEKYGIKAELGIGISTRSLRLIPGERIIREAAEASCKALQETTLPIVGFRVNPEKYREYLSKEAANIPEA